MEFMLTDRKNEKDHKKDWGYNKLIWNENPF